MAAGILLVREAGGFVGTIEEGGKLFVERSIVAANANVYEGLRKVLQSA
jgi:myo-inositol-1(or 4)-monophosphatase